jgi:hypothetical protein
MDIKNPTDEIDIIRDHLPAWATEVVYATIDNGT